MPLKDNLNNPQLTVTALGVSLGILAAIVRAMRKRTTLVRVLVRAATGALAAFIGGSLVLEVATINAQTVLGICGLLGWGGGEAMDLMWEYAESRIQKRGETNAANARGGDASP